MMRIDIYYRTGTTKDGKSYRVPHTLAWGFDMTVQLNGNMKAKQDQNGYYVEYDPAKAGIKVNQNGYLVLNIID